MIITILHIIITTTSILNLRLKQLRQKYWRIHNAQINTENIHKYLQHKIKQNHKILKNYCVSWKLWQMPKIQAENLGGNLLRKTSAENFCGKLLRKTSAENFCGKLLGNTKSMRLTINDRTKADVESPRLVKSLHQQNCRASKISAPIKTYAEKFCARLLCGLGRISNCWLPLSLAEELSFRSL